MLKAHIFCFIILAVISASFFTNKREKNKTNTVYSILLIVSLVHLVFDTITVYTIHHMMSVSAALNRLSHQIFLGTLLMIFYIVYVYLVELINSEANVVIGRKKRTLFPFFLSIAGVIVLPLNYVETAHGNYSRGFASMLVYACIDVYSLLILHLLVKYHTALSKKKIKAIVVALLCELVTAMYQLIFPYSLVSALGILLLNLGFYITVENPDAALVEQLKIETARADAANNAKTSFLANVSHEIRTPINAILGMNEMILRESAEKEVKNYASEVKRAAKSLLNIINDLLDITKIEAGKLTVIPVEYSLASLINDVHTMFELKAADKGLKFNIDIKGDLPSTIIGDDIRLKQVLINLLNNAIKYTNSGNVYLNISSPQDGILEFCVKDTGIGIKPYDLEKLYQPFTRIEEERNRNIEGTGLGLNITMKLLEQMGSRLDVQSVYGEGSSFSFIISQPTVDSTPINKSALFAPGAFSEKQYQVSYQAPNAKILIVDDNDMNRRVIASLLKETKVQTFEAESGEICLNMTAEQRFDVILMDHMMPGMDGIQTLRAMRARENDPCHDTPIVIVTANAIVGAKEAYLEAGFTDFLSKPIDPTKLEQMIFSLLDKSLIAKAPARAVPSTSTASKTLAKLELPVIEGVDWNWAKLHFNAVPTLLDTVKMFMSSAKREAETLSLIFYQRNVGDFFDKYRIQVHSMKTSASTIGIVPLAGMAATLENAARNQNIEILSALHPIFVDKWLGYVTLLKPLFPNDAPARLATDNEGEISAIMSAIRSAAENMDVDMLDALSKQLDSFVFDEERADAITELKADILTFNVEKLMTHDYIA